MLATPQERFVISYYMYAKKAEKQSGIPALFALAQSALETGWGNSIKGNMLFGIKKGAGINYGGWHGDTQWITTTEYATNPTKQFPIILSGYPIQLENGKWKYKIKAQFRAYQNAYYSIMDWAGLLMQSGRYKRALDYKEQPYDFAKYVVRAGYATDPDYEQKIISIMQSIEGIIQSKKLDRVLSKAAFPKVLMVFGGIIIVAALINNFKDE